MLPLLPRFGSCPTAPTWLQLLPYSSSAPALLLLLLFPCSYPALFQLLPCSCPTLFLPSLVQACFFPAPAPSHPDPVWRPSSSTAIFSTQRKPPFMVNKLQTINIEIKPALSSQLLDLIMDEHNYTIHGPPLAIDIETINIVWSVTIDINWRLMSVHYQQTYQNHSLTLAYLLWQPKKICKSSKSFISWHT